MVRIPYIRDKIIDEKIEKLLRQLGFKPNQVFSFADFEEKVRLLFNVLKPEEKAALINRPIEATPST